jgi:hypothetical protein
VSTQVADIEVTARQAIATVEALYYRMRFKHPVLNADEEAAIERDIKRWWEAVGGRM